MGLVRKLRSVPGLSESGFCAINQEEEWMDDGDLANIYVQCSAGGWEFAMGLSCVEEELGLLPKTDVTDVSRTAGHGDVRDEEEYTDALDGEEEADDDGGSSQASTIDTEGHQDNESDGPGGTDEDSAAEEDAESVVGDEEEEEQEDDDDDVDDLPGEQEGDYGDGEDAAAAGDSEETEDDGSWNEEDNADGDKGAGSSDGDEEEDWRFVWLRFFPFTLRPTFSINFPWTF